MQIDDFEKDGYTILRLLGAFSMHNVYPLQKRFKELVNQGVRRFAIDLSEVNVVDSAALGTLIQIYKEVSNRRGELFVFGCPDQFKPMFTSSKIGGLVQLYPSFEDALKAQT